MTSDYLPTVPIELVQPQKRPTTLTQLLQATDALKFKPVIPLTVAIQQLDLLCPRDLNALLREDPQLLRSKSMELVARGLMTAQNLHRALARTAGIVEVDVAAFDIAPKTFNILPVHILRKHELLLLGEMKEALVIASWCPTSEDLHSHLFMLTSRNVRVVWGERDAIAARLEHMEFMTSLWPMEYEEQRLYEAVKCKATAVAKPQLVLGDVAPKAGDIKCIMARGRRSDPVDRGAHRGHAEDRRLLSALLGRAHRIDLHRDSEARHRDPDEHRPRRRPRVQ